jgi:hypothetical protein
MTAVLQQTHNTLNMNMASFSNNSKMTPLFDWGINLSYEDHVNRHVPSGEHNHLVASIIQAERRGERFIRNSSDTIFDIPLCNAQVAVKEKEAEEKRLLASIQKVKDELSQFTANSDSEPEAGNEEEDAEEDHGVPDVDIRGPREKSGKDPKWAQSLKDKKQKALEAQKRKGLLSSLKTQSEFLAEVRKELSEQRIALSKLEVLQSHNRLLHKALVGAERKFLETHDQEFLVKNVHHNMAVWEKVSKPLLPPVKMVPRLQGSPGAFRTVMVPENERPIIPLSEFLREDW